MDRLNEDELWRIVPPEEKLDLLSKAQTSGFSSSVIFVIIAWTIAVSLSIPWMIWTSLVLTPFVYQFTTGRIWRTLRPKIMLEYLAARSASRRFAFQVRGRDLNVALLFRGTLEKLYDNTAEDAQKAIEENFNNELVLDVWIGLFRDTIIFMSERVGGAELELGLSINDKLSLSSSDNGAYANNKEVILSIAAKSGQAGQKYKVTSRHPAALVVFEKKILEFKNEEVSRTDKIKAAVGSASKSSLF